MTQSVVIDTNVAIAVLRDKPRAVRRRYRESVRDGVDVWMSTISLFELWYGVARSSHVQLNTERLRTFLAGPINVAGFTSTDAANAGELRAQLTATGTPVGPYDLLIGAQAMRLGGRLVTANGREFERVPGLVVEDWTVATNT